MSFEQVMRASVDDRVLVYEMPTPCPALRRGESIKRSRYRTLLLQFVRNTDSGALDVAAVQARCMVEGVGSCR